MAHCADHVTESCDLGYVLVVTLLVLVPAQPPPDSEAGFEA